MKTVVTTKGMLLKAVRKGDFQALLALADYWAESGDAKAVKEWDRLIRETRWSATHPKRVLNFGLRDMVAYLFYRMARRVNEKECRPWRLPPKWVPIWVDDYRRYGATHCPRQSAVCWDWCRDMADQLIRWVKTT